MLKFSPRASRAILSLYEGTIDSTPYGASKTELKMRIVKPKNLKTDTPTKALCYFHGGGMNMFDAVGMTKYAARYAITSKLLFLFQILKTAQKTKFLVQY